MTIRQKLIYGLGTLTLLNLVMGVAMVLALGNINMLVDELVSKHVELEETVYAMRHDVSQLRRYEKDTLLNIANAERLRGYLPQHEKAATNLAAHTDAAERKLRDIPELANLLQQVAAIRSLSGPYLSSFSVLTREAPAAGLSAEQANIRFDAGREQAHKLEQSIEELTKATIEATRDHADETNNTGSMLRTGAAVAFSLAVLLGGLLAVGLYRTIQAPLAALTDFGRRIADGDFEYKSSFRFTAEMGQLHETITHMVDAIRERVAYNRAIINRVPDPIIVTGPRRNIRALNSAACALLGHAEDDLIGKPLDSYQGADVYGAEPPIDRLARTSEAETQLDFTRQTGGETRYFHSRAATVRKPDGTLVGYMEIRQDITAVKRGELEALERSERIAGVARDADAIATTVADAASQLSDRVGEAARGADRQLQRSSESATAMDEMAATVREVARNASDTNRTTAEMSERARQGADIVEKVAAAIEGLGSHSRELRSEMEKLGTQASDIGNVLGVISDIADQTNLLALNAAIEAARAGDAGRGFAVVADEVRKLAEKTMNATREVEAAIGGIQQSARRSAEATDVAVRGVTDSQALANEAGGMLQEIVHAVQQASDQVNSIATAAEQQAATGDELNRIIAEVNEISGSTAMRMSEAETAIAELSAQAAALRRLMDSMT
ncbi:methyl-accepting chemotaxis protein [Nitratidesulfovibrio sp. SRB-5]|uniref:methyl-accepting chemotaxis protein n=1 Tax=Nitratidesulfovibrio sp. SRB-5 TaxID=2872636 RepID=UPI001026846F|nr:methyl-accepting chemotaxis protein [Nitratidesulfovibrio sp. SRB-5]MBZ2172736.1 PAS domain-containing protein [Nitratidesulfovibrio sp. SRB-5]RXF76079.1 PAS domain S-box protein [Desulfovibrio sp. DS-1]